MAEGAKSEEEEDIWNYKSITSRTRLKSNTISKEGGIIQNVRSRKTPDVYKRKNRLSSTSLTEMGSGSKLVSTVCSETSKRLIHAAKEISDIEIIDVDSQCDFTERNVTFNTTKNFLKNVKCDVKTKISDSSNLRSTTQVRSSLSRKSTPSQKTGPRSQRKTSGKAKKTSSKSPSSSQGSSSSSKDTNEGKKPNHGNIGNYFNVEKTLTPTKRKSSESADHLFDLSDDELIFLGEEKTPEKVPCKKAQVCSERNSMPSETSSQNTENPVKPLDKELEDYTQHICDNSGVPEASINKLTAENSDEQVKNQQSTPKVLNVVVLQSEEDDMITDVLEEVSERDEFLENIDTKGSVTVRVNVSGLDPSISESERNNDQNFEDLKNTKTSAKDLFSASPGDGFFIKDSNLSPVKYSGSLIAGLTTQSSETGKNDPASSETIATFTSSDQFTSLYTAKKQTSIFSFFKNTGGPAKSQTSNSRGDKTHLGSSYSFAGQNSTSRITSRPSLNQLKTIPAAGSAWPMRNKGQPNLQKAASEPAFETESFSGNQEPSSSNARNKRPCPFYKKMPGTSITVDAFRYGVIPGCAAYVLTHFHYDHYGGLTKKFAQPIFCSQVTGNLVESRLGVDKKWINRLPMWQPCDVEGVTLTLMEANHCPGAVIILFELKDGRKYLHTGDFRACEEMEDYSMLKNVVISELYLDTTYCNPSYAFPPQKEVIEFVKQLVEKHMAANPQTLIVCGAYTIGKERIFSAIAKVLDTKISVMNDKKKVLDCLEDHELQSRITQDWSKGQVHVLPMGKLNQQTLSDHLARHSRFKSILAFQPTGWTHSEKRVSLENIRPKWSKNGITLYGVPYSEHSSFLELKRFVQFLRPKKILPTVNNGNPTARKNMEDIFRQWMTEDTQQRKSSVSSSQQMNLSAWMS